MKRYVSASIALAALGLAAAPSEAALFDRGGGLIYDNDLNITWLQDANYATTSGYDADGLMTWAEAMTWADNLVYGGYSDWRLPSIEPANLKFGYDGTDGWGFNITVGSEMGHLYYTELGNLGEYDTGGNVQPGWGLANTSPFNSLQAYNYWTGYEYGLYGSSFSFNFANGSQDAPYNGDPSFYAIAVRNGDVTASSVPEPGTLMLLVSGLAGLALIRRKLRK